MPPVERIDGRRLFGGDPAGYDAARPPYPDWVFETLVERCGLAPGVDIFEIGPGSGLATRALLRVRPRRLTAIEPDLRLAAYLEDTIRDPALTVVAAPFEDVVLAPSAFDLGVSATAFHWLEEAPALARIADLLRPGGWWAAVWNVFGDARRPDPFHDATHSILENPDLPSGGEPPFALDVEARRAALERGGAFEAIVHRIEPWELVLDPAQTRALYATYSNITVRPDRKAVLDEIERIAREDFCGRVVRNMVTSLYIARRGRSPASA